MNTIDPQPFITELDRTIVDTMVSFAHKHAEPIERENKELKAQNDRLVKALQELHELYDSTMQDVAEMQRKINESEQKIETVRIMLNTYDMGHKLEAEVREMLSINQYPGVK